MIPVAGCYDCQQLTSGLCARHATTFYPFPAPAPREIGTSADRESVRTLLAEQGESPRPTAFHHATDDLMQAALVIAAKFDAAILEAQTAQDALFLHRRCEVLWQAFDDCSQRGLTRADEVTR